MKKLLFIIGILSFTVASFAQDTLTLADTKPISTAVPFLGITPDARAGALGDMGVATSPDIYSIYWNSAKYAFLNKKYAAAVSYTPWLRAIASGINLSQLVGFFRLNENQAFAASIRYFTVGTITLTSPTGEELSAINPNEFSIDATYALKLGENLSGSIGLRFIYSNITGGFSSGSFDTHPGVAFASDLGFFYTKELTLGGKDAFVNAGFFLSNLGSKISYSSALPPSFIPSNMRFGSVIGYYLNDYNKISWGVDFNKLLVPTPPIRDNNGNIIAGTDIENMSVISGLIHSLYDAPLGLKEKLAEVTVSTGVEYSYKDMIFGRFGYFYENPYKGNRQYLTAGVGIKYTAFSFDFSYLIPIAQISPLDGTIRVSLGVTFGAKKQKVNSPESQQK